MTQKTSGLSKHAVHRMLEQPSSDFEQVANFYHDMNTSFARGKEAWLTLMMPPMARKMVRMSAATLTQQKRAADLLRRTFQIVLADRGPPPGQNRPDADSGVGKRAIAYSIANLLFRVYFWAHNVIMVDTIARNIVSAGIPFDNPAFASRADRVAYRYYIGRYWLSQQAFARAHRHLQYAYDNCSANCKRQKRVALVYLVVAGLPIGLLPTPELLTLMDLDIFLPLVRAIVTGDFSEYHRHLEGSRAWFRRYEVYLTLKMRVDLLMYRSLLRRTFLLHRDSSVSQQSKGPPYLPLAAFHVALAMVRGDSDSVAVDHSACDAWDMTDTEMLVVSLIDAGLVRGYIQHERMLLVLDGRDKQRFGFSQPSGIRIAVADDNDSEQFGS
ncbi:hypothetical protein PYCC9005_003311 [Savitreella phatthalungensis]